jgi:hypothetical protein
MFSFICTHIPTLSSNQVNTYLFRDTPKYPAARWVDYTGFKPDTVATTGNTLLSFWEWMLTVENDIIHLPRVPAVELEVKLVKLPDNPRHRTLAYFKEKKFPIKQLPSDIPLEALVAEATSLTHAAMNTKRFTASIELQTKILIEVEDRIQEELKEWEAYHEVERVNKEREGYNQTCRAKNARRQAMLDAYDNTLTEFLGVVKRWIQTKKHEEEERKGVYM